MVNILMGSYQQHFYADILVKVLLKYFLYMKHYINISMLM